MKCPKCGYEIDSSSQYCMNCGAKKPKKEKMVVLGDYCGRSNWRIYARAR